MGHSDGGVTAADVAFDSSVRDSRISAAVILSGAIGDIPGTWFPSGSPALLAVHATDDEINPYESSQDLFAADQSGAPRNLVTIAGGSHLGPFTTDAVRPQVSAVIAAFFDQYLKAIPTAEGELQAAASTSGLSLQQG